MKNNLLTHQPHGFLCKCDYCHVQIYMKPDYPTYPFEKVDWRPFESWVAGNCAEGEWIFHDCPCRS